MQSSEFNPQALFRALVTAADPQTGDGSGTLSFSMVMEYEGTGTALPIPAEDVAGVLRDFVESRGWQISQFYGQPQDGPLDWPQEP